MDGTNKISCKIVRSVLLRVAFRLSVLGLSASLGCGSSRPAVSDEGSADDGDIDGGTLADGGSGDDGDIDGGTLTDGGPTPGPRVHRAVATPCPTERGTGDFVSELAEDCGSDAECTDGANGRCTASLGGFFFNRCTYDECYADSECINAACDCRPDATSSAPNSCLGGNCMVDSDCGSGGYCSPSVAFDRVNYPYVGYWCRTAKDSCLDDEDCTPGSARCAYDATADHWACSNALFLPP